MPTVTICKSCGKKLRIPDGTSAARASCPGCGAVISLVKTAITAKPPAAPPEEDEKPRPQPDRKRSIQDEPDDDEPRPRKRRIQDEPDDDGPRPRKKKRKRRSKRKSGPEIPWWVWGALAGTIVLFFGLLSAALIHSGYGLLLFAYAIALAITLPVSIVILVISMFIASAAMGGIDFGEAHVAIPKAGALLFVVSLILLIPFVGWLLAIPVWFGGLMGLFDLDFAEARALAAVNWSLNAIFKFFILTAILSGIMNRGMGDGPRNIHVPKEEAAVVKKIEALGGHCESDDEEGDHIVDVSLENAAIDDTSLALLRSFPKLRTLSLANTRVTDQGLRDVATLSSLEHLDLSGAQGVTDVGLGHLAALPKLQSLDLTGTAVTEGGIQQLRAARPGLQVER